MPEAMPSRSRWTGSELILKRKARAIHGSRQLVISTFSPQSGLTRRTLVITWRTPSHPATMRLNVKEISPMTEGMSFTGMGKKMAITTALHRSDSTEEQRERVSSMSESTLSATKNMKRFRAYDCHLSLHSVHSTCV